MLMTRSVKKKKEEEEVKKLREYKLEKNAKGTMEKRKCSLEEFWNGVEKRFDFHDGRIFLFPLLLHNLQMEVSEQNR